MDPRAVALILIFACAFVVMPSLVLRYRRLELRHRERMVAFDKGIPIPPDPPELSAPTIETYHLRGLVWLASGIGLTLTLFIILPMIASRNPNDRFYHEQNLKQLGYSKDEIRETLREDDNRWDTQRERSRGLAALGIVPIAVGSAYLFFYYEQKKRRPAKME
jgi:hypothetical protein